MLNFFFVQRLETFKQNFDRNQIRIKKPLNLEIKRIHHKKKKVVHLNLHSGYL